MSRPARKLSEKSTSKVFEMLLHQKGNDRCADCKAKSPLWASLDFGIIICMNCSGGHRSLGRLITRVRSVKIDSWNQDEVEILAAVGNDLANAYWEHNLAGRARPTLDSSNEQRQRWIEDKYKHKKYVSVHCTDPVQLYKQGTLNKQEESPQKKVLPKADPTN